MTVSGVKKPNTLLAPNPNPNLPDGDGDDDDDNLVAEVSAAQESKEADCVDTHDSHSGGTGSADNVFVSVQDRCILYYILGATL